MIIVMDAQKKISMVKSATNYQHENCAEFFTILLPETYGNFSLRNCTVSLSWQNKNNEGDVHLLKFKTDLYNSLWLESEPIYLTYNHTRVVGLITLWLEIDFVDESKTVSVMKTNRITMSILPSIDVNNVVTPVVESSILTTVAAMDAQMNTFATKDEVAALFEEIGG